jgi:protein-disulfide isomerase
MKKQHIALLGGAGLVLAFMVAGYLYKSQRADEIESMTQTSASPLVRDYSQSIGPADAKVVIVEFFDPGCETCRAFAPHVKDLLASRAGKLRHVLRYAPFHEGADTMVKILEAARRQGKYWETLQVMFDTQPQWASHHHPQPDKIWEFLPSVGLNMEEIRRDMNSPGILEIVRQDIADAKTLGVRKTPTFFVNGKPLPSFGLSQLTALADAEIAASYGR